MSGPGNRRAADNGAIPRRRLLFGSSALLAARPRSGHANQNAGRTYRVGFLAESPPAGRGVALGLLLDGLRDLGYVEGQNLVIEFRSAAGKLERLPVLATELVALKTDLLAAPGTQELLALKAATSTIPIVMLFPGDPVGAGLVSSLTRPGGNVTGTSLMFPEIGGKRLELMRALVPSLRRLAILWNPGNASTTMDMRQTEAAAGTLGLQIHSARVDSADRLDIALDDIARARPDGLVVLQDSVMFVHRQKIAEFALARRLATVFPGRSYVQSGGLVGYGPDMAAIGKRTAVYVDRILKGARPADLPVEQPTTFELVINMKTARALGLIVPPSLLLRASAVIE